MALRLFPTHHHQPTPTFLYFTESPTHLDPPEAKNVSDLISLTLKGFYCDMEYQLYLSLLKVLQKT